MEKIVIIGGGTAGWLTALVVNKFWKNSNVIVIESSKIGILGAGEGSTPNFGLMLNLLDINQTDFFQKTGATVKSGLNFKNWTLDKRQPKHLFTNKNKKMNSYANAFHFDGKLVGHYFKEIAVKRGVNFIDDIVKNVINTEEIIQTIVLSNGDVIDNIDFVFDCSGFARIIADKVHNEKWISYTEYLSLNKAIAYFLPQNKKYKFTDETLTQIISMNYGWMWQTPLQHRWGCGYVFDDSFITVEDAKKEIEKYVGDEITIQKVFDFHPGRFDRCWIGNSISIGLSYSFLEPLEATSLMSIIMQLKKLIDINFEKLYIDEYNNFCASVTKQSMIFIRYHYLCERFDTPFWKKAYDMAMPHELKNILDENNHIKISSDMEIIESLQLKGCSVNNVVFDWANYNDIFKKNKISKKDLI